MDWLKSLINKFPFHFLAAATGLSAASLISNLLVVYKTGMIDGQNVHQLLASGNGVATLILLFFMMCIKSSGDSSPPNAS